MTLNKQIKKILNDTHCVGRAVDDNLLVNFYWDVVLKRLQDYVFNNRARGKEKISTVDHRINRAQHLRKVYMQRILTLVMLDAAGEQ